MTEQPKPHSFQSAGPPTAADAPAGSQSPITAGAPIQDANPIDPYGKHREEVLLYRKRRERGEPFTLWDFMVFSEMNSYGEAQDYAEERWNDWTR